MSNFVKYLQTLDAPALRAMRHILAREMFQHVDLGNKLYNTASDEQKIEKEVNDKMMKIRAIDEELRTRAARSKTATASKKRKASKTPDKS